MFNNLQFQLANPQLEREEINGEENLPNHNPDISKNEQVNQNPPFRTEAIDPTTSLPLESTIDAPIITANAITLQTDNEATTVSDVEAQTLPPLIQVKPQPKESIVITPFEVHDIPENPVVIPEQRVTALNGFQTFGRSCLAVSGAFFITLGIDFAFIFHDAVVGGSVMALGGAFLGFGIALAIVHIVLELVSHECQQIGRRPEERIVANAQFQMDRTPKTGLWFRAEGNYLLRRGFGLGPLERQAFCIRLPETSDTATWFERDDCNGCLPSIHGGMIVGAVFKVMAIPYDICGSTCRAMVLSCDKNNLSSAWEIVLQSASPFMLWLLVDPAFSNDPNLPNFRNAHGNQVLPYDDAPRDFNDCLADELNRNAANINRDIENARNDPNLTKDTVDDIKRRSQIHDNVVREHGAGLRTKNPWES